MDVPREQPVPERTQREIEGSGEATSSIPEERDAGTDEHPALVRQCLTELMDLLIGINERGREVVRLRENTREILKGLRAA
jgi:hypothetical protein